MKDHDDSPDGFDPKNAFAGVTEKLETAAANLKQAAANMRRTAEVQKANAVALRTLNEKLREMNAVLKRANDRFRAAVERLRGGQPAPVEPVAGVHTAMGQEIAAAVPDGSVSTQVGQVGTEVAAAVAANRDGEVVYEAPDRPGTPADKLAFVLCQASLKRDPSGENN